MNKECRIRLNMLLQNPKNAQGIRETSNEKAKEILGGQIKKDDNSQTLQQNIKISKP